MSEIKYFDGGVGMPDAAFYNALEAASPYAATADRSYEGDPNILTGVPVVTGYSGIKTYGETGGPDSLTTGTLAANTVKSVNVEIPLGANSQVLVNILREAGAKLGGALAAAQKTVIAAGAGITLTLNLSRATMYYCLVDVKTAMDERGCPAEDRVMVVPPVLFGELAKDEDLQAETDVEVSGSMLKVMGFKVYQDANLDGEFLCYQKSAVAVAQVPAEYMRTEGSLVAAYNTGALVVEPNHVCCVTVS